MVAKVVEVTTDSEIDRLLDEVGDTPLILLRNGERFVVSRGPRVTVESKSYSQKRFLTVLSEVTGAWSDIDTEELKQDIRDQRSQDSTGRPAQ